MKKSALLSDSVKSVTYQMKQQSGQLKSGKEIEARRDNPRAIFETQAVVTISSLPPRSYVIHDISPSGMFLNFQNARTTTFELEENGVECGTQLDISFLFWRDNKKQNCSVRARIVRISKAGIGIAFLRYDPPETRRLREVLSQKTQLKDVGNAAQIPVVLNEPIVKSDPIKDSAKQTPGRKVLNDLIRRFGNSLIYNYLRQLARQLEESVSNARSPSEQARYSEAINLFSESYQKLAEGFVSEILGRLASLENSKPAEPFPIILGPGENLSMMEEDRLAGWLEIVEAIAETEQRSQMEIYHINRGLTHLAGFPVGKDSSPLDPGVLLSLLAESARCLPRDSLAERIYSDSIARYVPDQLVDLYQKLSALFDRAGEGFSANSVTQT